MDRIWYRIESLIVYLWVSQTKYKIHSPFLFDIVTKVFEKKNRPKSADNIEAIRQQLLQDNTVIEVEDFGAGSKKMNSNQRAISKIAKVSVKKKKYAHLIYHLINYFNYKNVLELGTSLGITTSYIASVNKDIKVTTIEGSKNIAAIAQQNFNQLNLDNIELVVGEFDKVLKDVATKNGPFDLIFIDGNHKELPTITYFEKLLPYTHNDTLLVFDDIHWTEEMEEAWQFIKNHPASTITIDIYQMGFVFLRKENKQKLHKVVWY